MEHYITQIYIEKLRHLSNSVISLSSEKRQHLLITGKNGSGKTSLLLAIKTYLQAMNDGNKNYNDGVKLLFNNEDSLNTLYVQGDFITAFFPANRKIRIVRAQGVQDVRLSDFYKIDSDPGEILLKYMVHLKTQQAYARNEGDMANADRIQKWFDRFEGALQILLDDNSIKLEYDYKEYNFKIHEKGRSPFCFDELSDGYSAVIHVVSDLILRMDKNWILSDKLSEYDIEGIVLIDELETHLHIELQKKILPFLTKFFPRIQFIVTTHSPYILSSISNAKAYDLERDIALENLSVYSSEGLAESYFDADEYSEELKEKIERYEYLIKKMKPTDEERAERAKIRSELKDIPRGLSREAREKFEEIERRRRL
ncbi:MAG: AAA family ATPase [Lachnospiraceae bacterium]|nr:AAA family ATPase [Lachnospiraceae bacterium]